ncbi:MAG TPA: hypothetical protein VMM78_01365 [Thermomicrobiales bacterium]|nr:hypothetical protein [Thermomicrobiales bacterium]
MAVGEGMGVAVSGTLVGSEVAVKTTAGGSVAVASAGTRGDALAVAVGSGAAWLAEEGDSATVAIALLASSVHARAAV